ncbi:hypothetical protein N7462_000333 [Penicillium macrosclerotiorum]|uniref:uncharacterized protein n=1 Tax=Penicillium macrosclerotiorum TaxID=303699 RepID=UPI0025480200|nr:uncharacterized protein N7462_000333 [Penicillium macrosclerotiorum]KAJ5698328.1 hypothetical protein N7462_000333 [Penicillium macrosclerotiorum]
MEEIKIDAMGEILKNGTINISAPLLYASFELRTFDVPGEKLQYQPTVFLIQSLVKERSLGIKQPPGTLSQDKVEHPIAVGKFDVMEEQ